MLQFQNSTKKSLSFQTNKRQKLCDAETAKSPVKLKDHNESQGKVWINPKTRIDIISKDDVAFEFNPSLVKDAIVPLGEFRHLASGQLIATKAQCHSLGEVHVHQGNNGPVNKQIALLRDQTHCVKLYLYGDTCSTLEEGKTYHISNVRLYIMRDVMYLNTTLSAQFKFKETAPLPSLVDNSVHTTNVKMIAKIAGVGQISKSSLCPACNRRCKTADDGVSCSNCEIQFPIDAVNFLWSLQLMLKDLTTQELVRVYFKNDTVKMLAHALELDLGEEKQVVKRLFEIKEPLAINFDFASKVVNQVKVAVEEW